MSVTIFVSVIIASETEQKFQPPHEGAKDYIGAEHQKSSTNRRKHRPENDCRVAAPSGRLSFWNVDERDQEQDRKDRDLRKHGYDRQMTDPPTAARRHDRSPVANAVHQQKSRKDHQTSSKSCRIGPLRGFVLPIEKGYSTISLGKNF